MKKKRSNRRGPSPPLTREALEAVALAYLNRFDATERRLRQVLLGRAQRWPESDAEPPSTETVASWASAITERYVEAGLLSDQRYAQALLHRLRERGLSRKAIAARLQQRGVADAVVAEVLEEASANSESAELAAARRLVRRRRLGPMREEPMRSERRHRDLGVLARAGFSGSVARQALSLDIEEFD